MKLLAMGAVLLSLMAMVGCGGTGGSAPGITQGAQMYATMGSQTFQCTRSAHCRESGANIIATCPGDSGGSTAGFCVPIPTTFPKTYTVPAGATSAFVSFYPTGQSSLVRAQNGTITITSCTATRVTGTFALHAHATTGEDTNPVNGAFDLAITQ